MKKMFPVFIIAAVCIVIVYYYINNEGANGDKADAITNARIIDLSEDPAEMLQFIYDIQSEPTQLMRTFNVLRKLIYSNDYKGKALERLVNMQRLLYHDDVLAQNQKDLHLATVEADLKRWKELDFKLIGSEMLPPTYEGDQDQICFIKVVYYTNTPEEDSDIYVMYELLRNEFDQWRILAWKDIEKFDIVK